MGGRHWVLAMFGSAVVLGACAGPSPGTPTQSDPLMAKGAVLYQQNCQGCHGGATGGSPRDIPPPHNANGHTWHHADQQLTEIILNGSSSIEGEQQMPRFKGKLTDQDVQAILAYMKTWWKAEQREWQATVTAQWSGS